MSPSRKRRGAPPGNFNAFKHGFYTTRLKHPSHTGEEITDLKSLLDEVALIRLFTRKLVETSDPAASTAELTDILRILCLTSSAIVRTLRTRYLITGPAEPIDPEIDAAIQSVQARLTAKSSPSSLSIPSGEDASPPSSSPQAQQN